jgi:hypothetical protein
MIAVIMIMIGHGESRAGLRIAAPGQAGEVGVEVKGAKDGEEAGVARGRVVAVEEVVGKSSKRRRIVMEKRGVISRGKVFMLINANSNIYYITFQRYHNIINKII